MPSWSNVAAKIVTIACPDNADPVALATWRTTMGVAVLIVFASTAWGFGIIPVGSGGFVTQSKLHEELTTVRKQAEERMDSLERQLSNIEKRINSRIDSVDTQQTKAYELQLISTIRQFIDMKCADSPRNFDYFVQRRLDELIREYNALSSAPIDFNVDCSMR